MNRNFEIPAGHEALLRCSRFPARSGPKSLIVVVHGYKGFKDWGMFPYVAAALSSEHEVITFNFSHSGIGADLQHFTELHKFARNTYSQEQKDMEILLSYLHQHPKLGSLPVFLLGHSRGGAEALLYALDHSEEIAGVISWNGVTSPGDLYSPDQKRAMREQGQAYIVNGRTGQQMPLDAVLLDDLEQHHERYQIIGRMQKASFPAVLIQGTQDGEHLRRGSADLTAVRPDIDWVQIEGGNHTFGTVHPFAGTTPQLDQAIAASEAFINRVLNEES